MRRRLFLGATALAAGCRPQRSSRTPEQLVLRGELAGTIAPLTSITIETPRAGRLLVLDGLARRYVDVACTGSCTFAAGGALGNQLALLLDDGGRLLGHRGFRVDASSMLRDGSGKMAKLWALARWTLDEDANELARRVRIDGKTYRFLVYWLRDHVITAQGAKYGDAELRSAIELYADLQREDGMIWDNVEARPGGAMTWWQHRFGTFARPIDDGRYEAKRIPVTNDVEAWFVIGLQLTWQATGDDAWMANQLDAAIRALRWVLGDPSRYSPSLGLLVRAATIDGWDFLADGESDDAMVPREGAELRPFFGDNHLYAVAAELLAAMLEHAGRGGEGTGWRERAAEIRRRTDELSWTDTHYRHHVHRDLGVDVDAQLTMSNALALTRGIARAKADAIIASYERLRSRRLAPVDAEWFGIHPPFPKGFSAHCEPGEYINGGLLPWIAAELARGCLTRGHEAEGVDVLARLLAQIGDDPIIAGVYVGLPSPPVTATFTPLPLPRIGAIGYPSSEARQGGRAFAEIVRDGVGTWKAEGVPFVAGTGLVISTADGEPASARIRVGRRCRSLAILHEADGALAGTIELRYADGTRRIVAIDRSQYGYWWRAPDPVGPSERPGARLVFRSDDDARFETVWAAVIPNPRPEHEITTMTLHASPEGTRWRIAAITAIDGDFRFEPGRISYGVPMGWGAGSLVRCLLEDLGGINDVDRGLAELLLTPRWTAANEREATVVARYGDGTGYAAYEWRVEPSALRLRWTGTAMRTRVRLLLPVDAEPRTVELDGDAVPLELDARYLLASTETPGVHELIVRL